MSDTARPATNGFNPDGVFKTRVSWYDRVSSGLMAMILLSLFLLTVLFSIWWFQSPATLPSGPDPVRPDRPLVPYVDEELDVVEFDGSESQAFSEVVELTGASIAELPRSGSPAIDGTGDGIFGRGDGLGIGNGRESGPRWGAVAKWSVIQEATDLVGYQRKLDFFRIEIGAVHKSNGKIWRIAQLSGEKVVTESTRSAESQHRHFVSQRKRLLQWDHQTITQAGVDLQDTLAVHFYPEELVVEMQQLIDARYLDRTNDLKEVTFKIVGTPGNFHFEIEAAEFKN